MAACGAGWETSTQLLSRRPTGDLGALRGLKGVWGRRALRVGTRGLRGTLENRVSGCMG